MPKVCIISPTHISYNPRAIKEADALDAAGFDVRVVSMSLEREKVALDDALMRSRAWRLKPINARKDTIAGRTRWIFASTRQRWFLNRWPKTSFGGLERAYYRYFPELSSAAAKEASDLVIGHSAGLPSAALAALHRRAKLGFDAEDFLRGEFASDRARCSSKRLTELMEEKYIPICDYVTAGSDGIARAYASILGIQRPQTILNVFSRTDREGFTPPIELDRERQCREMSLYWFSQTIGPDRGLEDALNALAMLKGKANLTVRGKWAPHYESQFWRLVRNLGIIDRVRVVSPAPPEQLIERASRHDVGLALEPGNRPNNDLAVSNKFCAYLSAGLAVAASATEGQLEFYKMLPEVGFVYPKGDAVALASGLRQWATKPLSLQKAKYAAQEAGETRFCWEVESQKFVKVVENALSKL